MKKINKPESATPKKKIERPVAGSKGKYLILLFIVVLISFIAFLPVLNNGFVWDDEAYILNNPLLTAINLKQIFSRFFEGNYHPLTMLIYSVEYKFFGLSAEGYHAVNLLLHLLNVILVFYALLYVSNKTEVAMVASLLFGIHPLRVESVAWASELKDLLYTFFFLASYICYLRYAKESKTKFYFYCLLLFLLSLLSKAMAVSLPLIFLLTDYFKGRKFTAKVWLEKVPFFVLSLIFGAVAILAQKSFHSIQNLDDYPLAQRIVFASCSFTSYLFKSVVPFHLSAFYPYPIKSGDSIPAGFYIYMALFLILVVTVFYSLRFSKKILFGIAFFTFTVFLVLQLLPVGGAIMADRYSYIPSIGIFYLAGEGFYKLWSKKKPDFNWKLPAAILFGIIIIFLSVQTYTRCSVWENGMTLWNDVISKEPRAALAYKNRGILLAKQNRYTEALNDYNKAVELKSDFADVYNNRGVLLMNNQKYPEALSDYNKAIELKPDYTDAYNNRGILQMYNQKYSEALNDYNKAIELRPGDADLHQNRAVLLASENKYPEALSDYNRAIELRPNFAEAYNNRGMLEMNNQKYPEAISNFNKAIELRPRYADAYNNRGDLFLNEQKYDQALYDYNKAIELQPTDAKAYNGLGFLLMKEKKIEQAINIYLKAIEFQPNNAEAYYNMAICEYNLGRKNDACRDLQKAVDFGMQQDTDLFNQLCR